MKEFFHLAPIPLAPGSKILPGNWGRIKQIYGQNDPISFREYALEKIRRAEFPEKPSRLGSAFVFPSRDDAEQFRRQEPSFSAHILYSVTANSGELTVHYANYNFALPDGENIFDRIEQMARQYWSETPNKFVEVLIPGEIIITGVAE